MFSAVELGVLLPFRSKDGVAGRIRSKRAYYLHLAKSLARFEYPVDLPRKGQVRDEVRSDPSRWLSQVDERPTKRQRLNSAPASTSLKPSASTSSASTGASDGSTSEVEIAKLSVDDVSDAVDPLCNRC